MQAADPGSFSRLELFAAVAGFVQTGVIAGVVSAIRDGEREPRKAEARHHWRATTSDNHGMKEGAV